MTLFTENAPIVSKILRQTCIAALSGTCMVSVAAAEQVVQEPALKMLREINSNPEFTKSQEVRDEAMLTTGSVVKLKGTDRVLYHLPSSELGKRFSGETASKQWPVHIARAQLQGQVTFRLGYKNAVSVMPEASNITLEINGIKIGHRPIQSPNHSAVLSFDVPNHILVPGYNAVKVTTRQRHRVDCSIDATHELWTEIDAARTGFVFERGNSVLNTLDGIAALARNKAGQVKMRLLVPKSRDANQVSRSILLAQHTALYSDFTNPEIVVAGTQGHGPGLDIFTGTIGDLRIIAPEYAKAARQGQSLQILSRDGDERVALILLNNDNSNGLKSSAFAKKLAVLFPEHPLRGSAQGVQVAKMLRSDTAVEGRSIEFSELGVQSEEFSGRLYRKGFRINLPSDYFSADYNQAEMHLQTAYAEGLSPDNKFIIRVNGVTVTGFSMSRASGHVYKNKMLRLPLSAFRPGVNSIEVEARLANKSDTSCDARAQINSPHRFVISGQSTIRFPRLAHLARLPDLSGTVSAGFPYVVAGKPQPTVISVPNPGYGALSTAASFATQIAVKAGVPLDFALQYSDPDESVKNAIIVGAYSSIPQKYANDINGINHAAFQTAWLPDPRLGANRQVAGSSFTNVDMMPTATIPKKKPTYKVGEARPEANIPAPALQIDDDVMDRWSRGEKIETKSEDSDIGFTDQVKTLVSSVFGSDEKKTTKTNGIANPNSDVLLSQRLAPNASDGVWTIVTGRNEQALRSGASLLARPAVLNQISGETVTINGVDQTVTSSITAQKFIQVRGFSLRNLHLIVAGWFSNNHIIYSGLMMFGLIIGGLVSSRLLRTVGIQNTAPEDAADA